MGINFKKSPNKFALYDSPKETNAFPITGERPYFPPPRQFDNLKKLPKESSSLRQTMNYGQPAPWTKRQTVNNLEGE